MGIKPIGVPEYIFTCDLCGFEEKGPWQPPNWTTISIAILGSGSSQINLCSNCLKKPIVTLTNKVVSSVK